MDYREYIDDMEETLRVAFHGMLVDLWTSMPVIINKTSEDGHTVELKMSIKGSVRSPDGKVTKAEYPLLLDVPVHFMGGGGVTLTHPAAKDDEGLAIFTSRPQDLWHKQGGVQDPIDTRTHDLSDARYLPGGRSNPRKLKNVSKVAAHLRSDDGKHTIQQHPQDGTVIKTVDPNDDAKDPFKDAKKFFESIFHPENGISHNAVSSGTKSSISTTHEGHKISADNGKHIFSALVNEGTKIVSSLFHTVKAPNVTVESDVTTISKILNVDNILNTGSINASLLASFAGGLSTGALEVAPDSEGGLTRATMGFAVDGGMAFETLPGNYANDAAAAAGGIAVGGVYRNGSVLQVRVS